MITESEILNFELWQMNDLPEDLYRQCLNLNFRGKGSMQATLKVNRPYSHWVAVAFTDQRKVVGWAQRILNYYRDADIIMTYVRRDYRRLGIGRHLVNWLEEVDPAPCRVITNTDEQQGFYTAVINPNQTKPLKERFSKE